MDCLIEFQGKDYTHAEFMFMLHDGLLDQFIANGDVKLSGVERTVLGKRSIGGEFTQDVKDELKKFGTTRQVKSQAETASAVQKAIDKHGIEAALEAVRSGDIKGDAATYIYSEAIRLANLEANGTSASENPEKRKEASKRVASLINELDKMVEEYGQGTSMLNYVYQEGGIPFNVEKFLEQKAEDKGRELTQEEDQKYRELFDKYLKSEARVSELEAEREKNVSRETFEELTKPKSKVTNKEKAKSIADKIRKLKFKEPVFKDENGNEIKVQKMAALDFNELVEIAAKAVEKTGEIADGIKEVKDRIKEQEWFKSLTEKGQKSVERQIEGMFEVIPDPKDGLTNDYLKQVLNTGIKDYDKFIERIKEDFPNMSDVDIANTISNYGKEAMPSKGELERRLTKMKRMALLSSQLADAAEGKRPKKSMFGREATDADIRAMRQELDTLMREMGFEGEPAENELRTPLDKLKATAKNRIEQLELAIEKNKKIEKSKRSTVADQELKDLQAERDAMQEIYDTQFDTLGENAIANIEKRIADIDRQIKENDLEAEKKDPAYKYSDKYRAAKERLNERKKVLNQLKEEAGILEKKRLEAAKKRTNDQIEQLKEKIRTKDYYPEPKQELNPDDELTRARIERDKLKDEFELDKEKDRLANENIGWKALRKFGDLAGLTRVLSATADLSFMGVQGGIGTTLLALKNPKAIIEVIKKMGKAVAMGDAKYDEYNKALQYDPLAREAKDAGLSLTTISPKLQAREETTSDTINTIYNLVAHELSYPISAVSKKGYENTYEQLKKKNPLKGLERAASGYLNQLRLELYKVWSDNLKEQGYTPEKNKEEFKRLADYINTITGRSKLQFGEGKNNFNFEKSAGGLSKIFFSPRNFMSGLKLSTPYAAYYFASAPKPIRRLMLGNFIKTAAVMSLLTALRGFTDDESKVEFSPLNSDFLKVREGDKRVDYFGGYNKYNVLLSKLLSQKVKRASGEILPVGYKGSEGRTSSNFDLIFQMLTNKLNPTMSLIYEGANTSINDEGVRKDRFGRDWGWDEQIAKRMKPIVFETISDLYKEDPSIKQWIDILDAVRGRSINTYSTNKKQ